ncbi:glycoside hydrolase family 95 protein [Actinoallomurus iriomotensis]|uniref:Alpha/beta hydrolase n=1 Tax=Actinoallomurus iriomotensis TaxID=478107 RepID=A0A9W6RGS6_9ACTN|nr:glycoside hydrolase family 95 protein [Actinoallomurus iriomotensis]GLY75811.1 alpha/beta hydrolase [Actinoallomurus iriomotensis]
MSKPSRRDVLKAAGVGAAVASATMVAGGALADSALAGTAAGQETNPLRLWYKGPAQEWLQALPVGNGRLGAMVFGGTDTERLQLNEDTIWAGSPHDYDSPDALAALPQIRQLVLDGKWNQAQRLVDAKFLGRPSEQAAYQPVGNLNLTFPDTGEVTEYQRELDLTTAITKVTYLRGGVRHTREVFASTPDQVIVMRLTADKPGSISFQANFDSPQQTTTSASDGHTIALDGVSGEWQGRAGAVRFQALARATADGGKIHTDQGKLIVEEANSVTLVISVGTSYRNYQDVGADPAARARRPLTHAVAKPYDLLRRTHVADHHRLFGRVDIDLGTSDNVSLPTDERIPLFASGADPQLAALYFQYGRYLLISCSRSPGQPANLQGLWNDSMTPAWESKYTVNINFEMNYWPAGPTNLADCWEPAAAMVHELAESGRRTAKTQYGADGWVLHHNTDGWRGTAPVDYAQYGMWPSGGAWLSVVLWDRYRFTGDKNLLRHDYPVMKGAAQFFLDTLVEDPEHGWLITNPSQSPEVTHHQDEGESVSICAGPTMDMQILRDLFDACAEASEILGQDRDFRAKVKAARARLAPMQIGYLGQLQEWLEDWREAALVQSRHVSHLWGVFPSAQIVPRQTPDLVNAAKRSLELRGNAGQGWSLAWKINIWARLEDSAKAYEHLSRLLTPARTAPNMFDLHPPFQIDGNFGGVSGITEMLLHSHAGELFLLPTLPADAWPTGHVRGLRARGGFEVGIEWSQGRLTQADVRSDLGEQVRIRTQSPVSVTGARVERPEANVVVFDTRPGQTYRIRPS